MAPPQTFSRWFYKLLNFVADLGGVAVIIGGSFVLTERKRIGRFIIGLGAGMGSDRFSVNISFCFIARLG